MPNEGGSEPRVRPLRGVDAAMAIAYGCWLFADTGPFGTYEDGWAVSQRSHLVVWEFPALSGVVGIAGMLRPPVRLPFGRAAVLRWIGSGPLLSWGLYQVVPILAGCQKRSTSPGRAISSISRRSGPGWCWASQASSGSPASQSRGSDAARDIRGHGGFVMSR